MLDLIRRVKIEQFELSLYDTGRYDSRGQTILAYELTAPGTTIFAGNDFRGSPLRADDSDNTLRALLGFLTLRPGDTDPDYFAEYTAEQLDFCATRAEGLSLWAQDNGPEFVDVG